MPDDVLTLARRSIELWNERDVDAVLSNWAEDVVVLPDPSFPDFGPMRGVENARAFIESLRETLGDGHMEIVEETKLGTRCLIRARQAITGAGSRLMSLEDWSAVFDERSGKIVRVEFHIDAAAGRAAAGLDQLPTVAFLGTGIMGAPMAANLIGAGIEVVAWNRTRSRAEAIEGAEVTDSAAAAAEASDGVVISMVPDAPEVEAVLLAAAEGLGEDGLAIDMSTIGPSAWRAIAERLDERGISSLDAPVTGSRPKAEDGTLTIMAGGEAADFERARPLFEAMGALVLHVGPRGHGQMIKLINNTLAAVNAAALAEGLLVAEAAGVDPARLLEVLAAGSGDSAMRALKSEPMLSGDFEPLFKLEHMRKDIDRCISEARALGLGIEIARTADDAYRRSVEDGLGERDFAAVIETIRTQSGLK